MDDGRGMRWMCRFSDIDWFPDANALDGSARAIKEIVGRAFGR